MSGLNTIYNLTQYRPHLRRINLSWAIRLFYVVFLFSLINPIPSVHAGTSWQSTSPERQAQEILNRLSPKERVGQLILITFKGMDVGSNTQIYDLITNHHIGGIVLLAANDNFTVGEDALEQLLSMNREIQTSRWESAQEDRTNIETGELFRSTFVPLFIAVQQEGDGYPYDQILNGLTPLPNAMATGATWNPELAFNIGSVLGKELSALGIKLLLGPSLDVLETSQTDSGNSLGTRTFNGDPFWVGQLGKEYIRGVHAGSDDRVATVAKHFPGHGSADRLPENEIATVRKSLEQLVNFDLVPFFAVTGDALSDEETTDALLASHIRYQGFQGNIRATTRPVSFDQQALSDLMNLPSITAWRENGGLMVSDDLGSPAVRQFYEQTNPNQPFDGRRVALNAFLAGNDLLYLGDITAGEDPDPYTTTIDILEFFTQKYNEDLAFAERVDQSALRILTLKMRLFENFTLTSALPELEALEEVGISSQASFEVAQEGATLISPSLEELNDTMPDPPNQTDRIVFISDTRTARQCSNCPDQPVLPVDALSQTIIRLYGPQASGQVTPFNLKSYSYEDLTPMLDENPEAFQIENDLHRAHWIVFAMLDVHDDKPTTLALHRFLTERPDLFQGKRLIVFAFNAPYFLDATNVSKLTAYYGLYSKTPSFIDVAARLLFRELSPVGSLPVSVPGVGYDLISTTMPDADQIIPLNLDGPEEEVGVGTATPEPLPTPEFQIGNTISVRTGVILDHNGNPVPDNTPVQFITTVNGEITDLPEIETTLEGIARKTIQVTEPGTLEIRVESEPATQSEVLRFEIPALNGELITPTSTEQPTTMPTVTPLPTNTPVFSISIPEPSPEPPDHPNLVDWIAAIGVATIVGLLSYRLAAYIGQIRWGVRSGFLALIGGLTAYSYLALLLPGSEQLFEVMGGWGVILVTFAGAIIGGASSWGWRVIRTEWGVSRNRA
jgi:beta-N-acetylhexosaminidase